MASIKNAVRREDYSYYHDNYQRKTQKTIGKLLKKSSSIFGVTGGILLASNIEISSYGFIFLALSSSQLLASSLIERDKELILYAGSIFLFVDLLGCFRWVLN